MLASIFGDGDFQPLRRKHPHKLLDSLFLKERCCLSQQGRIFCSLFRFGVNTVSIFVRVVHLNNEPEIMLELLRRVNPDPKNLRGLSGRPETWPGQWFEPRSRRFREISEAALPFGERAL
ncbi:MAG: hypothetical protein ACQETK_10890 [Pseudomonadota bacterium]